jgi:PKD repeat protein
LKNKLPNILDLERQFSILSVMNTTSRCFKAILALVIVGISFAHNVISQTTLLAEGWETAAVGQTPPAGWGIDYLSGSTNTWFVHNGTHPACNPVEGIRMAEFRSYNAASGISDRLKRTIPFSTAGFPFVNIDFEWHVDSGAYNSNDKVEVQWSTNGTNWNTTATIYRNTGNDQWQFQVLNLPAAAGNQSSLYIAFLFTSANGNNCHLDFVHVTGSATAPIPPTVTTLPTNDHTSFVGTLYGSVNPNGFTTATHFEFGLNPWYGSTISTGTQTGNTINNLNAYITDLYAGQTYHYRLVGTNAAGIVYGSDFTFTTFDTLPVAHTGPADVGTSTATLWGTIDPGGQLTFASFEYGLTATYGTTVVASPDSIDGDSVNTSVSVSLTGLLPNTSYHYRLKATSALGTGYGQDGVFTTLANAPPTVTTGIATNINPFSATMHGTVNPNGNETNVTFEFGPTIGYGTFISCGSFNGNTTQPVTSNGLSNLTPGTTYHYRIKAHNSFGTSVGVDSTFTTLTLDSLPVVITQSVTELNSSGANMWGFYNANGHQGTAVLEWGLSTEYGSFTSTNVSGFEDYRMQMGFYGCLPNTTYHYRAYLIYSGGIIYGADSTFTTLGQTQCRADYVGYPDSANFLTYHFLDQSYPSATSWVWNFGDPSSGTSNISTTQNPVHLYSSPGMYTVCLTITGTDSSCTSTYCDSVLVGAVGCEAIFAHYQDPTVQYGVRFLDFSTDMPNHWYWNFGDGTDTTYTVKAAEIYHVFNTPGLKFVTLSTQGQGCSAGILRYVQVSGSDTNCENYFTHSHTGKQYQFEGFMVNGQPATYNWNFGDGQFGQGQSIQHQYSLAGTYTVSLTTQDTNNCIYTSMQQIVVVDSILYHQVYGQVFAGNFPLTAGQAMIFSADTTANSQPFIDTAPIDSLGVYYFTLVPEGNYYLVATPANAPGYLPTYFGNTLTWQQSAEIQLGTANNPYTINLLPSGLMNSGPGSASGQINVAGFKTTIVDKVNMILLNAEGIPIGFTTVSASGAFSFPTLAYGVYYLHAELPGITSDYVSIELTEEKPDVTVIMTFSGQRIIGIPNDSPLSGQWIVYPNPFADELTVEVDMLQAAEASVNIFNFSGQLQLTMAADFKAGQNIITIPAMDLQPGIYILRIFSPEGLNLHRKLIKR